MTKTEKLEQTLNDLETLFFELRELGVPTDTLDALNKLWDSVELDLREACGS